MNRKRNFEKLRHNIFEPEFRENGLPTDRLADGSIVMDGHDYGNAYWIHPVIVSELEAEPGLSVTELGGEISIEGTFFEEYLLIRFVNIFMRNPVGTQRDSPELLKMKADILTASNSILKIFMSFNCKQIPVNFPLGINTMPKSMEKVWRQGN